MAGIPTMASPLAWEAILWGMDFKTPPAIKRSGLSLYKRGDHRNISRSFNVMDRYTGIELLAPRRVARRASRKESCRLSKGLYLLK